MTALFSIANMHKIAIFRLKEVPMNSTTMLMAAARIAKVDKIRAVTSLQIKRNFSGT